MTNDNNDIKAHAEVTDAVKELAAMADRELLSDARKAHREVTEAVAYLMAESYRLRAELKTSNAERDELRRQVETIKNGFEGGCYLCEVVGEMNKKLLAERDEARREVCRLMSMFNAENSVEIAASRSWDCFEKEKPKP